MASLHRLAIMANFGTPIGVLETREVQAAARTLGLEESAIEIRRAEDIAPAIEALKDRADALYVVNDPLINTKRLGAGRGTADDARRKNQCRSGWPDVLRTEFPRPVPARRRLRPQGTTRDEAGRHPGRAA